MNAKNIILAILMVMSFTACSSEIEGIDNITTNVSNGKISISVCMMTEGIGTKSGVGDELTINNYVIAVFEKGTNARIGYVAKEGNPEGNVIVPGVKEGIVNVVVVANVDDINEFNNLYIYKEFTSKTVGHLSNLTKVCIIEDKVINEYYKTLDVLLEQLTARVNVVLNEPIVDVNGKDLVTVEIKAYSYKANIVESTEITGHPKTIDAKEISLESNGRTSFFYYTYAVNNPTLIINAELTISINGNKQTIEKEITVDFTSVEDGKLKALWAGRSYNQTINANITVNQRQGVSFEYEIVKIKDNEEQNIKFK